MVMRVLIRASFWNQCKSVMMSLHGAFSQARNLTSDHLPVMWRDARSQM